MKDVFGYFCACLLIIAVLAVGIYVGSRLAAEPPSPVVLDDGLQREVEYLRDHNYHLRREVERLEDELP